jgi:hypothetical protein
LPSTVTDQHISHRQLIKPLLVQPPPPLPPPPPPPPLLLLLLLLLSAGVRHIAP